MQNLVIIEIKFMPPVSRYCMQIPMYMVHIELQNLLCTILSFSLSPCHLFVTSLPFFSINFKPFNNSQWVSAPTIQFNNLTDFRSDQKVSYFLLLSIKHPYASQSLIHLFYSSVQLGPWDLLKTTKKTNAPLLPTIDLKGSC